MAAYCRHRPCRDMPGKGGPANAGQPLDPGTEAKLSRHAGTKPPRATELTLVSPL